MIAELENLWEHSQPIWPGLSVEHVSSIDSTNTALLERARRGHTDPVLLIADHQTAGRGRSGKTWHSVAGQDLCASLGVVMKRSDLSGLSLAVGVALAQGLNQWLQNTDKPTVQLKWPNDLWVMHSGTMHKLGGILIETLTLQGNPLDAATGARYVVIGFGINVAARVLAATTTPLNKSNVSSSVTSNIIPAIGWCNVLPRGTNHTQATHPNPIADVLKAFITPLLHMVQTFETHGFAPWVPDYAQLDVLLGQPVRTLSPLGTSPTSPAIRGTALGVNAQGALQLQTADGSIQSIHSGEVSVRFA